MKVLRIQEDVGFAVRQNEELMRLQESDKTGSKKGLPEKLVIEIEAIHNGITKNHTLYSSEELSSSIHTWTQNYGKPVLKNHDMHTEPLGRVLSAKYGRSKRAPDRETVILTAEITDPDAIQKIADGRYQTVSVGGTAKGAVCSVCEKDVINEGYCGHSRGRTYKRKDGTVQSAHYILNSLAFDEVSFVNAPADIHAGVTNNNVSLAEDNNEQEGGNEVDAENNQESTNTENQEGVKVEESNNEESSALDVIDSVVGVSESTNSESDKTDEEQVEEVTLEEMNGDNTDGISLEEQVTTLEGENTTLKEEKQTLTEQVNELNNTIETLTQTKEQAETTVDALKEANLQMATYIRQHLMESIVDSRIELGLEEEANRESAIAEYKTISTKMLEKTLKESRQQLKEKATKKTVRENVQGSIQNPSLASNDQAGSEEEDENLVEESTTKQENNEVGLEEMADTLVAFFSKRNDEQY